MGTDPFFRVQIEAAEVLFMLGADDDIESVENIDAELRLADGSRKSVTFLTVTEIERILARWTLSGEAAAGTYLRVPDLVITTERGIAPMVKAIEDMMTSGNVDLLGERPSDE